MDAIQQLQHDAMNSGVPTSDLLRKALVVARKLNLAPFEQWITNELHGYADGEPVPTYRKLVGRVMVKHPFHGWRPIHFQDPALAKAASKAFTNQSVGELEHMLKEDRHGTFIQPFSDHNALAVMEDLGPWAAQASTHVTAAQLASVTDAVRNTLLRWALDLERDGVRGVDFEFTSREKEIAGVTTPAVTHIYNAPVTTTNVQSSGDNAIIVTAGQIDRTTINGIVEQLKSIEDDPNLSADDRAELKSERATLEAQLASPKPKREIVMGTLRSVWGIVKGLPAAAAAVEAIRKVLGM